MINSVNNEYIKELVKLFDKKHRDQTNLFLVEGEHLVNEAFKHGYLKEVVSLEITNYNVKNVIVNEKVMKKLSKQVSVPKVIGVCNKLEKSEITGNVLLLDDIQDPGNLGTIIRSAVAFNIQTIIISPESVDLYNDKVIRSTQGLLFSINIILSPIEEKIHELKNNDYQIIGSSVNGNNEEITVKKKYALIVGNEGAGVKNSLLDICDEIVTIKTNSLVESLNVGVATSIILYDLNRSNHVY